MILLTPASFAGYFRIDNNPALQQDINELVRQIERSILRYLFGNYWADYIESNTGGVLAQRVLYSRYHLYFSYDEVVRDYVLNYKFHEGLRGNQNETVYTKMHTLNGISVISRMNYFMKLMKSYYDRVFVTGGGGVLTIDLEAYTNFHGQDLLVFPFDTGFEFLDNANNIYQINSVVFSGNTYSYTFSPAPSAGLELVLRNIWKPLPRLDTFF